MKRKDCTIQHEIVQVVSLKSDEDDFHGNNFYLNMEVGEYIVLIAYAQLTNIVASEQILDLFQSLDK